MVSEVEVSEVEVKVVDAAGKVAEVAEEGTDVVEESVIADRLDGAVVMGAVDELCVELSTWQCILDGSFSDDCVLRLGGGGYRMKVIRWNNNTARDAFP